MGECNLYAEDIERVSKNPEECKITFNYNVRRTS